MKIKKTIIDGCYILNPIKKRDTRGSFHRLFCEEFFKRKNINFKIKQTNISNNKKKFTFRGFHYQTKPYNESKIISVNHGKILNITVDLRRNSKSFLKKTYNYLNAEQGKSILIPAGCANAFFTLKDSTIVHYYMSAIFEKQKKSNYQGFRFDDPFFNINLPAKPKVLSKKDKIYSNFKIEELN